MTIELSCAINIRRVMRRLLALLFVLAPCVCDPIAVCAQAQIPEVPGWSLLWHDEFDGSQVDSSKWEVLTRQNSYNNEKQYYLPAQAAIVGGNLRITASNQPIADKQYRSARLESWSAFGPGRFEARIDLPATQGMWPAFWLFPNRNIDWPLGGEIDILENRGSEPTIVSSAYHWPAQAGQCCVSQFVSHNYSATNGGTPIDFQAVFHTYTLDWEATELRFYVDGNHHFSVIESPTIPIFETAKNIVLNLAVGADFGGDPNGSTAFPQYMDVDYVRVWQRSTGLDGDYDGNGAVDAADCVIWRKGLDTKFTQADYGVWRANFGQTAVSSLGADTYAAVPEPATLLQMILLVAGVPPRRPRSSLRLSKLINA